MEKAIRLSHPGGVECLEVIDWLPQQPGPGEVRIRHKAIGVNFIDIYHRTGLYSLPAPSILGVEGAGVIEALGADVEGLLVGQPVAYAGLPGSYANTRLLPAWKAVPLPDALSADRSGAALLRGLTIHMLLTRTYAVAADDVLLVHAAAGGLGGRLTLWAKQLGASVIGTASSPKKAAIAKANGADHVILGRDADIVGAVADLTHGRGVDFAVDGIGGEMLVKTIQCTRRFGTVASIGEAAGPIPPLAVEKLGPVRSLTFARPSVMAYAAEPQTYAQAAATVLCKFANALPVCVEHGYPLDQAAQAHADLEAGRTTAAVILKP